MDGVKRSRKRRDFLKLSNHTATKNQNGKGATVVAFGTGFYSPEEQISTNLNTALKAANETQPVKHIDPSTDQRTLEPLSGIDLQRALARKKLSQYKLDSFLRRIYKTMRYQGKPLTERQCQAVFDRVKVIEERMKNHESSVDRGGQDVPPLGRDSSGSPEKLDSNS